jgi:lipase chaperone LimK
LAAATVGASERGAITYLVAELERRTENFKDALKHYAAARAEPNNPAGLVEWMNEQEQLAIKRDSNNDL